MADTNNPGGTGDEVTFEPDPKLEADASTGQGPAAVDFEPEPELGAAGAAGTGKRSAAETIREEAGKFGTQAADRARAFAGEGKDRATGALDEVAKMMQSAAADVDERLGADYGKYARSAADGISNFAETLRTKQVDDLIEDATALVRKSPVIAIGTAAAIGFVLARLVKSGVDAASDLADRDAPSGKSPEA
jgi:ElaB/YqjD/DUF883 family membrane-anchored ribosome-binding protein